MRSTPKQLLAAACAAAAMVPGAAVGQGTGGDASAIAVAAQNEARAVALLTGTSRMIASADGGLTWSAPLPVPGRPFPISIALTADGGVILVGDGRRTFRSVDGGASWTPVAPRLGIVRPDPVVASRVWGIGRAPSSPTAVWRSNDAGATWGRIGTVRATQCTSLGVSHGSRVLLMRCDGRLARSTTSGRTWRVRPRETRRVIDSVAFDSVRPGLAIAIALDHGRPLNPARPYSIAFPTVVLRSTDAGATWRTVRTPQPRRINCEASVGGVVAGAGRFAQPCSVDLITPGATSGESVPAYAISAVGGVRWTARDAGRGGSVRAFPLLSVAAGSNGLLLAADNHLAQGRPGVWRLTRADPVWRFVALPPS